MEVANISGSGYMFEYVAVLFFIVVALGIIFLALISSYLIVPQNPYNDKNMQYECGIDAFQDAWKQFDIRFYLVAVLFVIFDVEIVFMYPWAVAFYALDLYGFISMLLFIAMIAVGFIYEWKKGAMQWE